MVRCKECSGKGTYEIRNAYKPDFKQVVPCDSCQGLGSLKVGQKFSVDTVTKPFN